MSPLGTYLYHVCNSQSDALDRAFRSLPLEGESFQSHPQGGMSPLHLSCTEEWHYPAFWEPFVRVAPLQDDPSELPISTYSSLTGALTYEHLFAPVAQDQDPPADEDTGSETSDVEDVEPVPQSVEEPVPDLPNVPSFIYTAPSTPSEGPSTPQHTYHSTHYDAFQAYMSAQDVLPKIPTTPWAAVLHVHQNPLREYEEYENIRVVGDARQDEQVSGPVGARMDTRERGQRSGWSLGSHGEQ